MRGYRSYRISAAKRGPIIDQLCQGLEAAGCRIIAPPSKETAPFRVVLEAPDGERLGVLFYLFTISCVLTKNRPADECRFQIKYGSKDGLLHEIWQDPTGLYTTVFLGLDPLTGCFVSADPVLHNPTKMFISLEFKQHHMEAVLANGWHVWERESKVRRYEPIEVLVGARPEHLLDLIRFERAAKGLSQGDRQLLAEKLPGALPTPGVELSEAATPTYHGGALHDLAREFQMSPDQILDLIKEAPRLKMAVRGWVAEDHLKRVLDQVPGVTDCQRINEEGKPDVRLRYLGRGPIHIECKNVLRQITSNGLPRVDFQRTRASQKDRCSRYYRPDEFDVVAACLHAVTERWEFKYRLPKTMAPHKSCPGRLSNLVRVDREWGEVEPVLRAAVGALS